MNVVHAQLVEDVFAVGVNGVETGYALFGNLTRGHAHGNVFQNLCFGAGELHLVGLGLALRNQKLFGHVLTDVAPAHAGIGEAVANFVERGIFEQHAILVAHAYHVAHEIGGEVGAEENPLHFGKTDAQHLQLVGIVDVEEGVVEHHHAVGIFLELQDEFGFVGSATKLHPVHGSD